MPMVLWAPEMTMGLPTLSLFASRCSDPSREAVGWVATLATFSLCAIGVGERARFLFFFFSAVEIETMSLNLNQR